MPRKNRAKVSLQGACTAVAGKGWRSELLCRVLFWWRHATVSHRGKIWIAHHREDWMVELQCTSMRTLERAITQLKHNDPPLIETCQRLFGGLVIQHIRPTDVCVAAVENVYGRKLEQPAAMTDASPENGGPGTPKLADPEPVKNGGPGTPKMADPTKGITIMDYSMEYTKACTPPPVSACNPDQAESSLTGKGNTTVNGVLPPEVCPPLSPPPKTRPSMRTTSAIL